MSENEIFDIVLKKFMEEYNFTITHPYDDTYFEIIKNGNSIGGMNPSGYNLLHNLKTICQLLENELL